MPFYRTSSEIAQFTEGLSDVGGMWEIIKTNAEEFEPLFCHLPKRTCKEEMDKLIRYDFSEEGSNAKVLEDDDTVYAWELFLQESEGWFATSILVVIAGINLTTFFYYTPT